MIQPDAPPEVPPPSKKNGTPPLTPAASEFLRLFSAKRFANNAQREAVLELERAHGSDKFLECAKWAAEKGVGRGQAISMMRTALPGWGKPKRERKGGNGRGEPAGFAGLREWAMEKGVELG